MSEWFEICEQGEYGLNGPFGYVKGKEAAEKAGKELFGDRAVVREGDLGDVQGWGVGNRKDEKAFDRTLVGKEEVELFFGQYPHSRRDDNTYARWSDGRVEGFSGHRILHEIKLKEYNYLKMSEMSGDEVRKGGDCEIWMNGFLVDRFFFREIEWALSEADRRLAKVHEYPIRLWEEKERKELVGRKVYYRGTPAVIDKFLEESLSVMLKCDGAEFFPMAPYEREDMREGEEVELLDRIKDSVYSHNIWWWRK